MAKWIWTERTFNLDFPLSKFPDLLERVRGTPARVEDRIKRLSRDVLTRSDGKGWSIQQNIGHLMDLGDMQFRRVGQILAGETTLIAADMSNKKTNEADHNEKDIADLLREFRNERTKFVARLESVSEADWGKSALHPRLNQPMRIVDIAYFDSEHDDYHLARIGELIRALT